MTGLLSSEFQSSVQRMHELIDLDWFGEIAEESCLQTLLDVAWHSVRAEGNHGNVRRGRVYAQDFQGFHTADAGQIDVHQDHRRLSGARYLNAESTVQRGQQSQVGAPLDELLDQLHVRLVVLDIEHGARPHAGRDWRSVKRCGFAVFEYKLWCSARDQLAPEHASRAGSAFYAEYAPHQFRQPLGHHQADARACHAARLLSQTIERLE